MASSKAGRAAYATLAVLVVAIVGGIAHLWPDELPRAQRHAPGVTEHEARVVAVREVPCRAPGQRDCAAADARLLEGPERGELARFDATGAGGRQGVGVGDRVFVAANDIPPGTPAGAVEPYALTGFQRHTPLLWLAVAFVAAIVLLGRVRGVMSLIGLAISLALVVRFVVPAILDGRSPVAVAVVGALAVMVVTITLSHGLGPHSLAAIAGTTVSLGLTVALASLFIAMSNITGVASDESPLVLAGRGDLSLEGLVLAGMIIGALGVLDDLTVSQASTVMAMRRLAPTAGWRRLYREAVHVGRDHVAATVNTLVLAYVGAALPVLLILSLAGTSLGEAVNIEQVAREIVGMLVGSIGLVAAVPITTAVASLLATRLPARAMPAHSHAH